MEIKLSNKTEEMLDLIEENLTDEVQKEFPFLMEKLRLSIKEDLLNLASRYEELKKKWD